MYSWCINVTFQALPVIGAAVIFFLIPSASIHAQVGPPQNIESSDIFAEVRERRNREAALRGAEIAPPKSRDDPRSAQVMVERMSEDFRRLQLVRNEMVRALKTEKPLEYKSLIDKTAEIHKRASRLKAMMAPETNIVPGANHVAQGTLGKDEIKIALIDLCNGIITFVESPVFKAPGLTNAEEAAEARRILQNIIDLSGGIRRSAEALGKNGK